MDFRILGPLEVSGDDGVILLSGGKQRALLAILLLHANQIVSVDRVIDLLWGESTPTDPLGALQVHMSQLRRTLASGLPSGDASPISTQPPGYVIRLGAADLDLWRFERLVAEGRLEMQGGSPRAAADRLEQALGLWRGRVLADLGYESFAQVEIERLEEQRLTVLEDRIEADLAVGRHRELIGELQEVSARFPFRERLRAQLMVALYRSGRQAEALQTFQETYRVLAEDLGVDPGPGLRELEKAILEQDPSLELPAYGTTSMVRGPHAPERSILVKHLDQLGVGEFSPLLNRKQTNLPVPPTPLVGRDRDVENLLLLLRRDDVAVVTLTGAGGSGKSRLAIQVGAHLIGDYPDGVWFVPLASLADPGLVVAEIAKTLGLREGGGTTFGEVLGQHLRVRRLLLLLDNLEHLLPVVASTLADLAAASPGLVLLATSREALRIAAEHEFPVPPLAPADASELFAARAKSVRPDFELSEERLVVGAICERLDRLPLAIELAAARVRVLPPTKLLERLEKRLPLLAGGPRDAPARHRTLRATITWSHDLLEEKELRLFARLSVFSRGCTLEAAEAVCTADVETLGALIEKNLIHRDEGGEAEPRYAMLETIREFALERLDETSECEEIQRRHAEYFIAFALIAEPHLSGREQRRWLDRLEADNDNFRVAHRWELDHGDPELALRLARALVLFWTKRGHVREGRDILLASLERASPRPSPTRAGALDWAGYLCRELGEHSRGLSEQAVVCAREANAPAVLALALAHNVETDRPIDELVKHLEEAKALAEKAGDPLVLGIALNNLASVTVELERAFALFEESYRVRAGMGDLAWMALSLSNLAETALDLGEITQAREFGTKALELSREAGDRRETVFAATALAWIALDQNRIEDASGLFTEALALAHEISNRTQAREALQGLATVAAATGDGLLAAQLAAAAEPTVPGNSGPPGPARRALTDRLFTTVRAETDPAQWEDAWRQGTAMSLAQATAKILETTSGRRT